MTHYTITATNQEGTSIEDSYRKIQQDATFCQDLIIPCFK
jgi:hypothetical protein